jgi:hypothetical protein
MSAIDRVMKAYLSTRKLTVEQTELVRAYFSKFIEELMAAKTTREPTREPPAS